MVGSEVSSFDIFHSSCNTVQLSITDLNSAALTVHLVGYIIRNPIKLDPFCFANNAQLYSMTRSYELNMNGLGDAA